MPQYSAIHRAATLLRDPLCVARMRAEPLPSDVSVLLRILAGDAEAANRASEALGKAKARVHEAAEFYVTQILFHSAADPYRTLGVRSDASREELRTNLALLMRWLHPDVAGPKHRGLTERVIKAWNELKVPEARATVDQSIQRSSKHDRRRRQLIKRRLTSSAGEKPPSRAATKTRRQKRRKAFLAICCLTVIGGIAAACVPEETLFGTPQFLSDLLETVGWAKSPAESPAEQH